MVRARTQAPGTGRSTAAAQPRRSTREPVLARLHRLPPVAFGPDWAAIFAALAGREVDADTAGAVYAFDSGRSGLCFALERLAEAAPLRRQVVVPAYTCYSVAAAVEHAGLELVVCDIDPQTLDFVPGELEQVAGSDTLCIVAAQLFGCGADLDHASEVARRAGCHLIDDAAQASDPADDGHARGKASLRLVSTGRGKPVSTAGGGFVTLQDIALRPRFEAAYARLQGHAGRLDDARQAARVALMKLLIHPRLFWAPAAIPRLRVGETIYPEAIVAQRPEAFRQRLYARLRRRFEAERQTRRAHAVAYRAFLRQRAEAPQLRALDAPGYAPHRYPAYLARDHAALGPELERARRTGIAPVYPAPLTQLARVRAFCANPDAGVPGASWVARHLVTLPTHGHVDTAARDRVMNSLQELGV